MAEEKKRKRRKRDLNFYASRSLSRAERAELGKAGEVIGLGDEIALIRTELRKAVHSPTSDRKAWRRMRMLTEALDSLVKAMSLEHKMSPANKADMAAQLRLTLEQLGEQLMLPPRE